MGGGSGWTEKGARLIRYTNGGVRAARRWLVKGSDNSRLQFTADTIAYIRGVHEVFIQERLRLCRRNELRRINDVNGKHLASPPRAVRIELPEHQVVREIEPSL